MTNKIYEYKDDNNWFLASFRSENKITGFGDDESNKEPKDDFYRLTNELDIKDLEVHLVKFDSSTIFLRFLIDTIKVEKKRSLKIIQHHGTMIVTENDQLKAIYLPKKEISVDLFFNQSDKTLDVGDTILIATRNEGKTKEFRKIFEQLGLQVENLNDYPDLPEVAETGMTFEENARLKAETIAKLTGKMTLADDSGLMVDILGGMPGVWSARFAGKDATDAANNAKLLHELAMVFDQENRTAHFHTTLVVAAPGKESLVVDADWDGYIANIPKGENGFGYDPLFLVGETGKTSAELTIEEKNTISHRAKAVKKLMEVFPSWQDTN